MTLIYLPITSTKATPQVNAYRTINVQLPPLELKILFAILSCWTYRQWGSFRAVASGSVISLPISATPVVAIPVDMNNTNNSLIYSTVDYRNGSFRVYGNRADGNNDLYGTWLAICF